VIKATEPARRSLNAISGGSIMVALLAIFALVSHFSHPSLFEIYQKQIQMLKPLIGRLCFLFAESKSKA
jgi:hypothetical protein